MKRHVILTLAFFSGIVCASACFAVIALAGPPRRAQAASKPCPTRRITPRRSVAEVFGHFGHPSGQRFSGGNSLTSWWVGRSHNWTAILYVHPRAKSNPQP